MSTFCVLTYLSNPYSAQTTNENIKAKFFDKSKDIPKDLIAKNRRNIANRLNRFMGMWRNINIASINSEEAGYSIIFAVCGWKTVPFRIDFAIGIWRWILSPSVGWVLTPIKKNLINRKKDIKITAADTIFNLFFNTYQNIISITN